MFYHVVQHLDSTWCAVFSLLWSNVFCVYCRSFG